MYSLFRQSQLKDANRTEKNMIVFFKKNKSLNVYDSCVAAYSSTYKFRCGKLLLMMNSLLGKNTIYNFISSCM